jgi:sec-independent protein translocase protein TatA
MNAIYAGIFDGGPELIIVLGVIALLFGSARIPKFARSLGQAKREFDDGMHETANGEHAEPGGVSPR